MSLRHRPSRSSLVAAAVLVAIAAAPLAFAQTAKPKPKKGGKPAASAAPEAAPAPAPEPAPPPPPPADSASAGAADETTVKTELPNTPPPGTWDSSDTREDPSKPYYFVGLRYRGTVIPKFLVNMFVNEGSTFYSNTVGAEFDIRKDAHSTNLWIGYTGFGFGDTLFFQKGKSDDPNNYTIVSSSLWALFLGLDEMWSVPMDQNHHWDFEYGFGVGLGFVFGTLYNDWAYQTSDNSGLMGSNGKYYAKCTSTALPANAAGVPNQSCDAGGHSNSQQIKVNNYQEPNWFGGGSIPAIFPQIYFPSVGVRFKPVKEFEGRIGLGFSLTGFWFGISGNYGLEKPTDAETPAHAPKKETGSRGSHGWL